MISQGKPRAETSGSPEDVQLFDYIPRAGEDGQFKLFNYRHLASEIASETPRTLLDVGELEIVLTNFHAFMSKNYPRQTAL